MIRFMQLDANRQARTHDHDHQLELELARYGDQNNLRIICIFWVWRTCGRGQQELGDTIRIMLASAISSSSFTDLTAWRWLVAVRAAQPLFAVDLPTIITILRGRTSAELSIGKIDSRSVEIIWCVHRLAREAAEGAATSSAIATSGTARAQVRLAEFCVSPHRVVCRPSS
jgi:hypothetical protein